MASIVCVTYSSDWESMSEFPAGIGDEVRRTIIAAPEWQVRERWFAADVSLQAGSFLAHYVRTPLIDYAMAFRYSLEMLAVDGVSSFSASGGPRLDMVRHGGAVDILQDDHITSSIEIVDLLSACVSFRRQFIDEVTERFPDLLLNDLIEFLFRESGLREKDRERFVSHSRAVNLRNKLA
jgi:hypothetical protein